MFRRFGSPRSVGSAALRTAPPSNLTPAEILTGMTIEMDANNVDDFIGVLTWFGNPIVGTPSIDQSDSARRATWNDVDPDFNGEPSATFSGSSDADAKRYSLPDLSALTQGEVFAVLKNQYTPGGYPNHFYSGLWRIGSDSQNVHYPYPDGHIYDAWGTNARKDYGVQSLPFTTPHVYNVSSVAGSYIARFNGTTIFSTATNTAGFSATPVFGGQPSGFTYNGKLAYLVICNSVQSAPARAAMNQYLSARFGITLS